MDVNRDRLEQLLLCIGAKTDLHELMARDARFGVRLQQTIRGCLGGTTLDADIFMESVFGKKPMDAYRQARRAVTRGASRSFDAASTRAHAKDH